MKKNRSLLIIFSIVLSILLAGCGSASSSEKEITIGSKSFTEQLLLSKMTHILLEENGFKVEEKNNMGSNVLRAALTNNQVDMAWDYTGTGLVTYLDQDPIADQQKAFETVKDIDSEKNSIVWMNLSEINNTYTLMMRQDHAKDLGIESISDLAEYINQNPGEITMATDAEFSERPDGLKGLQDHYGFEFGAENVTKMKLGLTYEALKNEQVEVSMGFATDSRIKAYNLINLNDDKQFFPAYSGAVVIKQDVIDQYPEIKDITAQLSEKLNDDVMQKLNYAVDVDEKSVEDVATTWLEENGLLE